MWELIKDPFYDYGPNDKGIGLQLGSSLVRVFSGFVMGALVAIPVGILIGASSFCKKMFYPIVPAIETSFPVGVVPDRTGSVSVGKRCNGVHHLHYLAVANADQYVIRRSITSG